MWMVFALASALFVSLLTPLMLRPLLHRYGIVDVPNERSSHSRPVLRALGLAPLLAVATGSLTLLSIGPLSLERGPLVIFLVVTFSAGILGLTEDVRGLPVRVRAGVQLLIGVAGGVLLLMVTGQFDWILLACPIAIAGYINVANFMDGINAVSGMHGAIVGVAYALIGVLVDSQWLMAAGLILALAFFAFLPWNVLGSGAFLGDVGSYLLGAGVATIGVIALAFGAPFLAVVGPLMIYLGDTAITLIRRIARGERWYAAHRSHVYQRLTDLGLNHYQAAALVSGATLLTAVMGLLSVGRSEFAVVALAGAMVVVTVGYIASPRVIGLKRKPEAGIDREVSAL